MINHTFLNLSRINKSFLLTKRSCSTTQNSRNGTADIPKDSSITRVRIWKSGYFTDNSFVHTSVVKSFLAPFKGLQSNIGHVSIETKEIYGSLWPDGIYILNKYKKQPGNLETNPARDEDSEGRPADHLVDLHTLNVDNIREELYRYKESGQGYHLFGSNRLMKQFGVNSCSGLAYDLLISGGIKELLTSTHFIRDYIVTTPNNLAELVLEAQKNEQEILKTTKRSNKL